MDEKHILVVEDEYGTAEVLQLMLELEGYRVVLAANGREALDRIARHVPDLVLTDFMMPLMTGAQLGVVLRASPRTKDVRIVMMSGIAEVEVQKHFSGYDAFMQKPFLMDDVVGAVRAVLAAGQARRRGDSTQFSLLDEIHRWCFPRPSQRGLA